MDGRCVDFFHVYVSCKGYTSTGQNTQRQQRERDRERSHTIHHKMEAIAWISLGDTEWRLLSCRANRMRQKWFNYSTFFACQHMYTHIQTKHFTNPYNTNLQYYLFIWLFCLLSPGSYSPIPHSSIPCLLPQSSLPLTHSPSRLPSHFFLSIHVSGSLLIICDLLKYIHRFTLLFYAACFLPRSQRVLSSIITLALLHPPLAPCLFFLFLSLLPRMPHTLYLSFTVRSKVLSWFSFYTETDNRRHSSSCPHSVIWGKSSLMFLWTKIRLLLWITQYSTAIWHRLPRHCISIQLGSHGARSDIKSQLYISVEQTPAALRIVQSDLSFEALRWAS